MLYIIAACVLCRRLTPWSPVSFSVFQDENFVGVGPSVFFPKQPWKFHSMKHQLLKRRVVLRQKWMIARTEILSHCLGSGLANFSLAGYHYIDQSWNLIPKTPFKLFLNYSEAIEYYFNFVLILTSIFGSETDNSHCTSMNHPKFISYVIFLLRPSWSSANRSGMVLGRK